MIKLLVSVRDAHEAHAAMAGGAQIIDVKEPQRGALGAGSLRQLAEVAAMVNGYLPLSAALGELLDYPPSDRLSRVHGYSFAKVGMSGCARVPHWPQLWADFIAALPQPVLVVAVVYADYEIASAPPPHWILDVAKQLGISYLLIDTFDKSGGNLLSHLTRNELSEIIAAARETQMTVALAGALTTAVLPRVISMGPDIVAVRGMVCRGGRTGRVDSSRVRQIAKQLSTTGRSDVDAPLVHFVDSLPGEP